MDHKYNNSNKAGATIKTIKRGQEERSAKQKADKLDLPYVNLATTPIDHSGLSLIPRKKAVQAGLIVVKKFGNSLKVAAVNPKDKKTKEILDDLEQKGFSTKIFIASQSSIDKAWNRFKKVKEERKEISKKVEIASTRIEESRKEISNIKDVRSRLTEIKTMNTSAVIELILGAAIELEASDVHFEAMEKEKTRLRFRIDGILQDVAEIPADRYNLILSRIKILSELKLNIHNKPQDGRFSIVISDQEMEIRTSIIPASCGENIVLRLLNPQTISLELEDLGLEKYALEIIKKELKSPNGMIVNTGPTGSGKTTTLYAFVKKINNPNIKIVTIENPVEYHLEGVEQTQINEDQGYTFEVGLKSILRQDPDTILVGEIRDNETAVTSIHAALTGHLVFTTLHTNDAAGAIPRLIDMGINPKLIPSALNLVIAQRLVRRVCKNCSKKYSPNKEIIKKLKDELKTVPEKIKHNYPKIDKGLKLLKAGRGCKKCNFTGYKGRVAVMEFFQIDRTMEKFISKSPSVIEVKEEATKKGMITMKQNGILKVLNKITTAEELERVLGF